MSPVLLIMLAIIASAAEATTRDQFEQLLVQDLPEVVHVKLRGHRPHAAAYAAAVVPVHLAQRHQPQRHRPPPSAPTPADESSDPPADTEDIQGPSNQGKKKPQEPPAQNANPAPSTSKTEDLDVRPSAGGAPTPVGFGLFVKHFYGADCKESVVTMDVVMTLKWSDNRSASLVPHGHGELTLGQDSAAALMWMPNVFITNSNLKGSQVTSTGVTVFSGGKVLKVQRLLAEVKHSCGIRAFPFDDQVFNIRVASTTLMADQLQLSALAGQGISGVKEGVFAGQEYDLVNSSSRVFIEKDGNLVKSRGELSIEVRRVSEAYVKTLLVPYIILVTLGYCAFLFPLAAAFIMPRVTISIIGFLSSLMLSLKTSSMLPVRGSTAWIDVFEETCLIMNFTTLCLNIVVEILGHEFKMEAIAQKMQFELRCALPLVDIVLIAICFYRTDGGGDSLWWLNISTKLWFFGLLIPYIGWCVKRIVAFRREGEAK